jgi:hypothetical protein
MEVVESKVLCAPLSKGPVAKMPADKFYNEFNLHGTCFAEYYFKEMQGIFHFPAVDDWPKMLSYSGPNKDTRPPISLSLVCFMPPNCGSPQSQVLQDRVALAHEKAREMVCASFSESDDHTSIHVAMNNYPTIALFMTQVHDTDIKKKPKNIAKAYWMSKIHRTFIVLLLSITSGTGHILKCCGLQPHLMHLLPTASM